MTNKDGQTLGRIGIDISGTFTDLYYSDGQRIITAKSSTTPEDFANGFFKVIRQSGLDIRSIEDLVHGSTIVMNAVIERKLPLTPFITTEGFRDLIEIGRYHREKLYQGYGPLKPGYPGSVGWKGRRHRHDVHRPGAHQGVRAV